MSSYRKNRTKSDISASDNSNNVPVLQQINSLNSQPVMQVRRPSDLNGSFTQPHNDSQHSTVHVLKSPEGVELKITPLNLIHEESSVKEQSDNQAYESLLFKKPVVNEFMVKEPVHWSQMYTSQGSQEDEFSKYAQYIGDKLYCQDKSEMLKQISLLQIIVEFLFFAFYFYQFPILLFGVAKNDYNQIYNLEVQLPLLLINFIQFAYTIKKQSRISEYIPLGAFIPFISSLIDLNKQVIYLQLLHGITIFRFHQLSKQLYFISLSLRQYTIYFFLIRVSEIHFFQMICGFLLVFSSTQANSLVNCSIFEILTQSNNNLLTYSIKIAVFIFSVYELALIAQYINTLFSKQNVINQNLDQISQLIRSLPFNLRIESLQVSYKQMHSQLTQIDYDKLPNPLKLDLFQQLYQNQLFKLPIMKYCLSKQTIQNILQNSIKERILEPNDILFDSQQEHPQLYFLLEGRVQCYQKRGNQYFYVRENANGIYNQQGFFFQRQSDIGVRCETSCRVLELSWDSFIQEVNKSLSDVEKMMMCLDRVQFNRELNLIGLSCQICDGNHELNQCKKVHYIPPKQMLIDYIYFDEHNQRTKYKRGVLRKKSRSRACITETEHLIANVRHQLQFQSSDTLRGRKTITSIGLQLDQQSDSVSSEENQMSQYVQNLSPVPYVAPVSSASSYPLKEIQQKKQNAKDSFMVHQKRYREKRQSHNLPIERIERDLSPSIIKYATIQDKKSQKSRSIISEDHGNEMFLNSSNNRFSKYGIQSSKFTNETAKQFMNNPFDLPLYEVNPQLENNHSYSEYFPQYNIDQAILSYKQYQDSVISKDK